MLKRLFLVLLLLLLSQSCWGKKNPPVIVILGDSLSAGFGLARGEGWVDLLQQRLRQQAYPHKVINASISGDTTGSALARLPQALSHQPDILVVELGGNDGLRGLSLSDMEKNLRRIIEQGQHHNAKILLIGMQIPPNYGPVFTQRFNELYGKLATEYQIALVPFLLAGMESDRSLYQQDQIHPNATGQPVILQNVWDKLQPLL